MLPDVREVDLKIFRVFDDLIPAEFEAVPSLKHLGRAATAVNRSKPCPGSLV
jgi:hypothetical protein